MYAYAPQRINSRNFQMAVQLYLADCHQLPGDDPAAAARWGRPATVTVIDGLPASTAGDGAIEGDLQRSSKPAGRTADRLARFTLRWGA